MYKINNLTVTSTMFYTALLLSSPSILSYTSKLADLDIGLSVVAGGKMFTRKES